jgi:hypothetical protein
MPSLLNDTEKNNLSPLIEDLFDTFARDIIVHKEPKKIILNQESNSLLGYEDVSTENVQYIPENRTIKAKIKYENLQDLERYPGIPNNIAKGFVKIKVRKEGRDYILNGTKTEKIEIDGNFFNIVGDEAVKKFFNTIYYVFYLEATK